jgi:hypothetical protein
MTQDTLTATAAQYHHRWQQYLHEQEIGRRSSHLTPRDRAWCDEAITERMARVGFDRASVLATIAAELRGDTCLQHPIIMVPNAEHDTTGDYMLLVNDRPPVPPAA